MAYEIKRDLITQNRPENALTANGIVVHNTANMGDTAQQNRDYFNTSNADSSVHFVVDADTIIQCIPINEVAWHAGPTANRLYLGIELCTTNDPIKFNEIWKRACWLFAKCFKDIEIFNINFCNLRAHAETSDEWKETDHQDPILYFQTFGVTMTDFRAAVQRAINTGAIQDLMQEGKIFMTLKKGDKNQLVLTLQSQLQKLGYKITVDGNFTEETEHAVIEFQLNHDLDTDGIVGPITDSAIDEAIKAYIPTSNIPKYKVMGAQFLKDMGLTTELHKPLEIVDIGTLGTILQKLYDRFE